MAQVLTSRLFTILVTLCVQSRDLSQPCSVANCLAVAHLFKSIVIFAMPQFTTISIRNVDIDPRQSFLFLPSFFHMESNALASAGAFSCDPLVQFLNILSGGMIYGGLEHNTTM